MSLSNMILVRQLRTIFFGMLTLLMACHPDKYEPVEISQLRFRTTDASEMYFKNIRQSDYQVEQNREAGLNIYRSRETNPDPMLIEPALIINWKTDQAFIFLEMTETKPTCFTINKTDTVFFEPSNQKNHARTAILLYNAILKGDEISYFLTEGDQMDQVFLSADRREEFRRTVFDFLRLVEIR